MLSSKTFRLPCVLPQKNAHLCFADLARRNALIWVTWNQKKRYFSAIGILSVFLNSNLQHFLPSFLPLLSNFPTYPLVAQPHKFSDKSDPVALRAHPVRISAKSTTLKKTMAYNLNNAQHTTLVQYASRLTCNWSYMFIGLFLFLFWFPRQMRVASSWNVNRKRVVVYMSEAPVVML